MCQQSGAVVKLHSAQSKILVQSETFSPRYLAPKYYGKEAIRNIYLGQVCDLVLRRLKQEDHEFKANPT